MNKVAIMTDSNSGITQAEAKKLGIRVIPMPFTINGEEYLEDINLTQEEFYEHLKNDEDVSTSQPSIAYVSSIWDELLESYDEIIYIPMSSGLSKSCASASNCAEMDYKGKVYVVDNQRISVTQKQSVLDAMMMVEKGYSAKEIYDRLMEYKMHSDIYIMVDTLKYLKKGGRITPAAAAVGNLLKIKPILLIKGEKLDKFKMMNRTASNAKRVILDTIVEQINGYLTEIDGKNDNCTIAIAYSGTDDTLALEMKQMFNEVYPNMNIFVDPLSLSVSCHIGDGALGVGVCKLIPEYEK